MWFQDLFNYDFRRTEQCIIPYATQEGEISFCAYNTGVGWRNIIEKMHMTATLTKWYAETSGMKSLPETRPYIFRAQTIPCFSMKSTYAAGAQDDLDKMGIAKNAREEKVKARSDAKRRQEEDRHMEKLYRQLVLKEQPTDSLVQIGPVNGVVQIAPANGAKKVHEEEEVGAFGD